MNSSIISGAIGGLIVAAILAYASARVRTARGDGELRYGWGLVLLGLGCSVLTALAIGSFFFDNDVWTDRGELIAVIALIVGFGLGAVYSFGEYFLVRGKVDDEGIEFYTPWTGRKAEKWQDLRAATFNSQMNWYVLEFNSGSKIRISSLTSGYGAVLDQLKKRGVTFE